MNDPAFVEPPRKEKKGKYRREKAWDDETVDHWKIDPFTPEDNKGGPFAAESSFATLFPQYREQYLRQIWGQVTKVLDTYHIRCELNCVEGSMSVFTTRKTWDPYIIIKARDFIKLLSRSVPFEQAVRVLQDDTAYDIIKISSYVSSKERLIRRRQRLIGADGATLKAIELLSGCYVLVQGNTVSVIGPYDMKGIKWVRKTVEDCMSRNIHPIYNIKTRMIQRELMKDPELAEANWDRFLPKFKKHNQPKKKKPAALDAPTSSSSSSSSSSSAPVDSASAILGAPATPTSSASEQPAPPKKRKTKKERERDYTPFPPPMPERKEDKLIASGEYFLSPEEKRRLERDRLKQTFQQKTAEKAEKRAERFIPPKEVGTASTTDARKAELVSMKSKEIDSITSQIKQTMKQQEDKLSLPDVPTFQKKTDRSREKLGGSEQSRKRRQE